MNAERLNDLLAALENPPPALAAGWQRLVAMLENNAGGLAQLITRFAADVSPVAAEGLQPGADASVDNRPEAARLQGASSRQSTTETPPALLQRLINPERHAPGRGSTAGSSASVNEQRRDALSAGGTFQADVNPQALMAILHAAQTFSHVWFHAVLPVVSRGVTNRTIAGASSAAQQVNRGRLASLNSESPPALAGNNASQRPQNPRLQQMLVWLANISLDSTAALQPPVGLPAETATVPHRAMQTVGALASGKGYLTGILRRLTRTGVNARADQQRSTAQPVNNWLQLLQQRVASEPSDDNPARLPVLAALRVENYRALAQRLDLPPPGQSQVASAAAEKGRLPWGNELGVASQAKAVTLQQETNIYLQGTSDPQRAADTVVNSQFDVNSQLIQRLQREPT